MEIIMKNRLLANSIYRSIITLHFSVLQVRIFQQVQKHQHYVEISERGSSVTSILCELNITQNVNGPINWWLNTIV